MNILNIQHNIYINSILEQVHMYIYVIYLKYLQTFMQILKIIFYTDNFFFQQINFHCTSNFYWNIPYFLYVVHSFLFSCSFFPFCL